MEPFNDSEKELIFTRRAEAWARATSTEPADFDAARKAILALWRHTGKPLPKRTQFVPGPTQAMMTEHFLDNIDERGLSIQAQFYELKEFPLRDEWNVMHKALGANPGRTYFYKGGDLDHVGEVGEELRKREWLCKTVMDALKNALSPWTRVIPMPHCCGQVEWYWIAFQKIYMELTGRLLKPEAMEILDLWEITADTCGGWMCYGDCLIIIDRPARLNWKGDPMRLNMQLHCEGGSSIEYRDGTVTYHLNGIQVPGWIATTPLEKMDANKLFDIQDVDVRREFVQRIGVERLCIDLGARTIDRDGDYELILLDLKDGRRRPYLKMLNPSIKVWHVEGVHPDCATVKQALAWRNGTDEVPEIIT